MVTANLVEFNGRREMDKQKALESALAQIERQFGKGSIMRLGAGNPVADLLGVQARNVTGMNFAGLGYRGPMTLNLYGRPGSLPAPTIPTDPAVWAAMDLRRGFALHAYGFDRIAGDVTALAVTCAND